MTFKEAVNNILTPEQKEKLSKAFKFNVPVVTPPVNTPAPTVVLKEDKLADGTVIKSDSPEFIVGSLVTVVTTEGELPAPDGEHTLSNGDVIVVAEGKVTEVKKAAPTEPQAPMMPEMVAQMKAEFEAKLAEANKTIEELKASFSKDSEEFKTQIAQITTAFNAFSELLEKTPSAEPIKTPENVTPNGFNKKVQTLSKFKK